MADKIDFGAKTAPTRYGDGRTFFEHTIVFQHRGRVVGLEKGARRTCTTRAESLKAARARIAVLRTRRLFAIRITRKHITDGEARSCSSCAIAQALWHNQERMGFPKREFDFEVSPYGFGNARGIVMGRRYGDDPAAILPDDLPDVVFSGLDYRGKPDLHGEPMTEWAMRYDNWAESRFMSLAAWREENSAEDDDRPYRPSPSAFVLDLDAFEPTRDAG